MALPPDQEQSRRGVVALVDRLRRTLGFRFPPLGGLAMGVLFRILPRHAEVELVPGIVVPLDFADVRCRVFYWQGARCEAPIARQLVRWAKASRPDPVFIDVGANIGFFSLYMKSQVNDSRIFAFEPNPDLCALHRAVQARNNGLRGFNSVNMALGAAASKGTLSIGGRDSGHSTLLAHPQIRSARTEVAINSFDSWKLYADIDNRAGRCVAKIDVEGFELAVLEGMAGALKAQLFRGLVVEVNPFTLRLAGRRGIEIFEFLASHGYRATNVPADKRAGFDGNAFFEPAEPDAPQAVTHE